MYIQKYAVTRRSVRRYKKEDIPLNDLMYILDVARYAPSGGNRQPWRFLLVSSPEKKKEIREICEEIERKFYNRAPREFVEWAASRNITWRKPHLTEAPVLILVFGRRGTPYWIESVWLMIGYLLLAAEEKGYATLTYTPSDTRWANSMFNVPEEYRLQTIIPIGKPDEAPSDPGRLPLKEIVFVEEWGNKLIQ